MAKEIKSIWIFIVVLAVFSMINHALIQIEIDGRSSDFENLNIVLQNEEELDDTYVQRLKTQVANGEMTIKEFQTRLIKNAKNPMRIKTIHENTLIEKILDILGFSQ